MVPPTKHSGCDWERGRSLPVAPGTKGGRNGEFEMNQLTIVGFTGNRAEAHYTPSGTLIATISVAPKVVEECRRPIAESPGMHGVVSFGIGAALDN